MSKVIVVSFDRWHAGFLGCYGNHWVDSPALDQLALDGTVFDWHFVENLNGNATQHAWWTGRCQFPLSPAQQALEPQWIPRLSNHGISSCLIHDTDCRTPLFPETFQQSIPVHTRETSRLDYRRRLPGSIKTAISQLKEMECRTDSSELLWLHLAGLPIDQSSLAYEELYSDEPIDEPNAGDESADDGDSDLDEDNLEAFPPRFWRRNRSSPRELAAAQLRDAEMENATSESRLWRKRRDLYSGQVTQWDAWLGRLFQAAKSVQATTPTLIVFTAAAGEQLGEHPESAARQSLYHEVIQVPCIIDIPLPDRFSGRRQQLTQAQDLPATILDWFGLLPGNASELDGVSLLPTIREDESPARETLYFQNEAECGLRTANIYFRSQLQPEEGTTVESVFRKPEDRWDANDVARQYLDDIEGWMREHQQCAERIKARASSAARD